MFITVIRHGQSHVNVQSMAVKSKDAGLTEIGTQQVQALRQWFLDNDQRADVLYTSTMKRALETTAILQDALGADPLPDHRLREIPNVYPSGEIVQPDDMPRKLNGEWVNKQPFAPRALDLAGTESWMHFRTRLGQFMDDMIARHSGQHVYVVAHGGVISAMFDNIFNVGPYRQADVHIDNASWSRFQYREGVRELWYIRDHNRIDHLVGTGLL